MGLTGKTIESQDILNLAQAAATLIQNRNVGNGSVLNSRYRDDVLDCLSKASAKYAEQLSAKVDLAAKVDSIPVVRCKDCKFWVEEYHWCCHWDVGVWPTHFCSEGDRRE